MHTKIHTSVKDYMQYVKILHSFDANSYKLPMRIKRVHTATINTENNNLHLRENLCLFMYEQSAFMYACADRRPHTK